MSTNQQAPHETFRGQLITAHGSREDADHFAGKSRIACLHITFKEGEGL